MKTFLQLVKVMNRIKIIYLFSLVSHIFWMLPSFCIANYDHVLYYKQLDNYKLLIAFPKNNPDSSKGVLFYDNNWYLPRYSNSQEIRDFFSAFGFKDKDSRLKLRQKFQPNAIYDRFTSWNWQALFDWLSDMKIEKFNGSTILIKEYSPVEYIDLENAYKSNDYFPVFTNLGDYLPKLEIEVNNLKTNYIDFGEVQIGAQKKLDVIITAKNINNAILFISPILKDYLDKSIKLDRLNEPIFLFNEIPDTLQFVFSPSDSQYESIFWNNDTLTYFLPLSGEFLPDQVNLFIAGIRKKRMTKIEYFVVKNSKQIVIITIFISIIGILFWLHRKLSFQNQTVIKILKFLGITSYRNKHQEKTSPKPIKKDFISHPHKKKRIRFSLIKSKVLIKQFKQYWLAFNSKNKLSDLDVDLINNIKKLYYDENADIQEFIKVIKIYFGQDKDQNKKLFMEQLIENQKIKEKDQIIKKLQLYKEFFYYLKEKSGNKNLDDSVVKKILIEKACFCNPKEVYRIIEKYCYSPIIVNYEKFNDINKPINENIDIFQKNREKLLNQRKQIEELLMIHEEHKYFIEGVKQGYIHIKTQSDDLENTQIDYERFLAIQKLCLDLVDIFYLFLKTVVEQFNNVNFRQISECWVKIIDNILVGRSGVAGIKSCLERLHSFRNPLIIMKFFEINSKENLETLNEEIIKSKFRDKVILAPFCMPYLQDLRRLFLYLENKELRSRADDNLFTIVMLLNDRLFELFKYYNIYLHQLKLFTRFDQKQNLLAKEQNSTISYLEQIESTKLKLKKLRSSGKLIDNYIYDVDFIGYDIISKNSKNKTKASQVYVYNEKINK